MQECWRNPGKLCVFIRLTETTNIQGVHIYMCMYIFYHWEETQKRHPWHFLLAYRTLIVYRNLTVQPSGCFHPDVFRTICMVLITLHPLQRLNSHPASWGFCFPLQWGSARWRPRWGERRSWVLQWNPGQAAACRWCFRCTDQSSSYRTNGLLPHTVWKVVLFGK